MSSMLKGNSATLPPEIPSSSSVIEHRVSSLVEHPELHVPQLSSPFMSNPSIVEQVSKHTITPQSHSTEPTAGHADDIFSSGSQNPSSFLVPLHTPDISPPHTPSRSLVGSEIQRIRRAMIQDGDIHPSEYLERNKRSSPGSDHIAIREQDREVGVSIMETPVKGRRLKLFQETSEESFEESLMAGGYGRYRTADWVRQPQPVLLATPGAAGSSSVVSVLEQSGEDAPPTQKEAKKRKRLAAFRERTNGNQLNMKLHPVELEGRGRVIIDVPANNIDAPAPEGALSKRKPAARRRKKGAISTEEKNGHVSSIGTVGDLLEKPNWPDAEFPWRLRTEERTEELKAEEAERLRWIERFLDHLSDDEDEEVSGDIDKGTHKLYGGKTVSSLRNPRGQRSQARQRVPSRSDSADALAALMSKEKIRNAPYLKKLRLPEESESDEEIVCICSGKDDGRELVQCDGCETWYHLECIGIRDVSELGKEEDPWFCYHCKEFRRLPSLGPELSGEPTFVPTEDHLNVRTSFDTPFFQAISLQASPMAWDHSKPPRTPTRNRDTEHEPGMSSGSSWTGSRIGPSTPQNMARGGSIYNNHTPGPFDNYTHPFPFEESPFDPTSTPSRGIKFGAPFATPKNNVWHTRSNGVFQTPNAGSGRNFLSKSSGTLSSGLDGSEIGTGSSSRVFSDDESPVRRGKSTGRPKARRPVDSPLALRSTMPVPYHLLESPIMHSSDNYKRRDFGHNSMS